MGFNLMLFWAVIATGKFCHALNVLRYEPYTVLKRSNLVALFSFDEGGLNAVPFGSSDPSNR